MSTQPDNIPKKKYIRENGIIKYNKDGLSNLEKIVNLQQSYDNQKWDPVKEWTTRKQILKNNGRLKIMNELIIEESELCDIKRKYSLSNPSFYQFEPWEDRQILQYILLHEYENQVGEKKVWQEMEKDIFPNRSWKNLKKRYFQSLIRKPLLSQFVTAKGKVILLKHLKKKKQSNKKAKKQNEPDTFSLKKYIKTF